MQIDLINIGLAFVEGFALIISPCILPILPIILSGSISGSKSRPYGIIFGFILSFALFTLFSRTLVSWFGLDLDLIRNISFILLIIFGLVMISTFLGDYFNRITQGLANLGFKATENNNQGGFSSGIAFGALVGLIWTPCAGPILAAVIVQTLLQESTITSFLIILAFAIGAGVPMLMLCIFGHRLSSKINLFQKHSILIRKILGIIIIVAVIFMYFGNPLITTKLLSPGESKLNSKELISGVTNPYPAPDFKDISAWINSPALNINELKGKVVLIDFWAYSCINCIRSLPYVKDWYQKYSKDGLVIVGVHSPEFDFERDLGNVKKAVREDGILYPVALDNNFGTWQNYRNHYWPAHFLIDKNGDVVYTHFGEGEYDVTENNIRYLLGLNSRMPSVKKNLQNYEVETPETYLGYARGDNYAGVEPIMRDVGAVYSFPLELFDDSWALKGGWIISNDKITSMQPNSAIRIHFNAQQVYAVMGNSTGKPIAVTLRLDDKSVVDRNGQDVKNSIVKVDGHNIYSLLDMGTNANGILEMVADKPGLEIYTFTFGG